MSKNKKQLGPPATWPLEALELYSAFYRARQQRSPSARHQMLCLDSFLHFQEQQALRFRDFPRSLIDAYLERFRPPRRRAVLGTIRLWLRFLYQRKELLLPLHDVFADKFPAYPRRRSLTYEQVLKVLNLPQLDDPQGLRDRALLEMAYGTGMRRGELAALELSDLDLAQGTVFLSRTKSGQQRRVPLTRWALHYLQRYLQDARPQLSSPLSPNSLWLNSRGVQWYHSSICLRFLRFYRVEERLGFPFTFHQLRHSAATHLLTAGASSRHVQELLGHQEANSTGIYTHLTPIDLVKMHELCHPRNHGSMPDFHAGTESDSQESNPSQ